jgi:hypothetical protein
MELRGRVVSKKPEESEEEPEPLYCDCCYEKVSDLTAHCIENHVLTLENGKTWQCKLCDKKVSGYPKPSNLMRHADKCFMSRPMRVDLDEDEASYLATTIPGISQRRLDY